MPERLNTLEDGLHFQLGAALTMEGAVLEILENAIDTVQSEQAKDLFRLHVDETYGHPQILEQVFEHFGWEAEASAAPGIESLKKQGESNSEKADAAIVDAAILQNAIEVEHHEIAVYENLSFCAIALARPVAVELLRENLEQEKAALAAIQTAVVGVHEHVPLEPIRA